MRKDHDILRTKKNYSQYSSEVILQSFRELVSRQEQDANNVLYPFSDYCIANMQSGYVNKIFTETFEPYHDHDYFEINYVMRGQLYQYLDDNLYELRAGDFILLPPGVRHSIYGARGSISINLLIQRDFIRKIEYTLGMISPESFLSKAVKKSAYILFTDVKSKLVRSLFIRMQELSYKVSQANSVQSRLWDSLLETLFYDLLTEIDAGRLKYSMNNSNTSDASSHDMIIQYIKKNLATVSIESLSKHFGISAMGLNRIFRRMGYGYSDYVANLRISQAKYLLKKSSLTNREISYAIGLGSPEYFSRFFKKYTGKAPSAYRRDYCNGNMTDTMENS
ncbi:MAG: helix-turn-helix domain-containing protein [Clostridia bacterium]|nr:helix-turn-helix domain-containing protein [Clostridia bacterium]